MDADGEVLVQFAGRDGRAGGLGIGEKPQLQLGKEGIALGVQIQIVAGVGGPGQVGAGVEGTRIVEKAGDAPVDADILDGVIVVKVGDLDGVLDPGRQERGQQQGQQEEGEAAQGVTPRRRRPGCALSS